MIKILVFVSLVWQIFASRGIQQKSARGRIINGTDAEEGEFPFAVNLRTSDDNYHLCGATILNENFILTAAHCLSCKEDGTSLSDPEDYNIQYGLVNITRDNSKSVDIKRIYCSNYSLILSDDYLETLSDIAIVELKNPLPDDGSWAPVTLSRNFDSSVQQQGVVIGWGIIDENMTAMSDVLQKLTVDVYNNTACGAVSRNHWDHHVCVGSKSGIGGTCVGDSGTAALVNGVQVGITSYSTTHPPVCGHENVTFPTVYSRIEKYFDWILDITPDVRSN